MLERAAEMAQRVKESQRQWDDMFMNKYNVDRTTKETSGCPACPLLATSRYQSETRHGRCWNPYLQRPIFMKKDNLSHSNDQNFKDLEHGMVWDSL